jgi:hypothetical protein
MQTIRYAFLGLLLVACSNNDSGNDGGTVDSGGGNDVAPGTTFNQTGSIVDFTSKAGQVGMVVTGGGNTVTTDSTGKYTLPVPKNTPYSMQIASGPTANTTYLTLNEQEWQVTGDVDRGKTSAVSNGTEGLLKSILQPQPDPTLSVLTIQVIATGACPSATGATISVPGLADPDAGADAAAGATIHMDYFVGGFPSQTATSATDGEVPSAIIWGLPATATFNSVTVTPPTGCTVKAFPTSDPTDSGPGANLVYTGNVKLQASTDDAGTSIASFMRVFLQ